MRTVNDSVHSTVMHYLNQLEVNLHGEDKDKVTQVKLMLSLRPRFSDLTEQIVLRLTKEYYIRRGKCFDENKTKHKEKYREVWEAFGPVIELATEKLFQDIPNELP